MNLFKLLTEKTQNALEQTSNAVREKIEYILKKPSLSVEEIASFINKHPDTTVSSKTYLGNHFAFYNLNIEGLSFYLETKGEKSDYILQLVIQDHTQTIFDFFSYREKGNTQKHLKLADAVNEVVK